MELCSEIDYGPMIKDLLHDLNNLSTSWSSIENMKNSVNNIINENFIKVLNCQSSTQQQNNIFKKSLFSSLENLIITALHNKILQFIIEKHQNEDKVIYDKCCKLSSLKVTSDQLGASEDYCIPLPATIVELASLDMHELPVEKLLCLSTAFDLALAELKGAIVDVISLTADSDIPTLSISDITPILATIIIHAKPMHLISNLIYIENFYFSKLSNTESECLLAFKTAVDKIKVITVDMLLPRSSRIYCDIGLEDVVKLTSDIDHKYDRKGQRICNPNNPLERHIENFTNMITISTLNNVHV